ncbi:MAG: tyrosine-type recombinase/integrase, partial [Caldisericia bacterium]|nr:tyrosine-type recombinase/integrase [Caldisericia bacterium]
MAESKTPLRDAAVRDFIASRHTQLTKETYKRVLGRFCRFLGDTELNRVSYTQLAAFKDSLGHLHGNTVHMHVTVVKSLFTYCVLLDLIEKNPAVRLQSPKVSRRPPVFLTESESMRLLAGVDRSTLFGKRNYAMIALMLSTGIRVGELVHVRLSDFMVDDAGDIFLNVLKGKGGKARRVKVPAETFAAVQEFATTVCRFQPMGPRSMPLCLVIQGHLQWSRGDVPLVRMSTRQIQETVTKAAQRAGLQKQVSPHTLRHTCFTLEMMEGANLLEIKEQAGHDYLGTTQKY